MKIIVSLSLLLFSLSSLSQTVTIENDTALINGKKVFYIKKVKKTSILQFGTEYSIRTMEGTEVIFYSYGTLTFMDDGKKAEFLGREKLGSFVNNLIENELFTENGFNEDGKRRYLIKHPHDPNKRKLQVSNNNINGVDYVNEYAGEFLGFQKTNTSGYEMVERNRNGSVTVFVSIIKQSGVDIGKISESSEIVDGDGIYQVILIKTLTGKLVAKARFKDFTSTSLTFITTKDSKTHEISFEYSTQRVEKFCKYLVDNFYL